MRSTDNALPDSWKEVFLLVAVLLIALVAGVAFAPGAMGWMDSYHASKYVLASGKGLEFTPFQMMKLRTDYEFGREFEVAYCGIVDSTRVVNLRVADIRAASEDDVIFRCYSTERLAVHTHSVLSPEPSEADTKYLLDNPGMVGCIYSGRDRLNCWAGDNRTKQLLKVLVRAE